MRVEDLQNFAKPADPRGGPRISKEIMPAVKYCMITPVRDEEGCIAATIESVLRQTIHPTEWIIVDDGSTDTTGTILDRYAREYRWIQILHRKNRGHRSTGGGIEAFIDAYSSLQSHDWEFLVNLDGDLTFAPDYFESCFQRFRHLPRLGIGGGTIYTKIGERLQLEKAPSFHVRGATKIYRRECWENLGGVVCSLGWDTLDEIKANQLGWMTQSFPDVQLFHHRVTGAAWGAWGNAINDGEADYLVGYHPLFFFLKCIRHIFQSPYLVRSVGMVYGFLRCVMRRTPQVADGELKTYLRRQQLRRLLRMSSIWK
jgi:glycosyltransferase involved in cell wall biosynthesis